MCKNGENFDIWKQNKKNIILGNNHVKFLFDPKNGTRSRFHW